MDTFWGLSGTAWTAIYTILTALLLLTAWGAAYIAWGQWKASRDAVEQARRAQLESSRPYVIVTVESTAAARNLFDLSVKNIGKRPAFRVKVDLDPAPTTANTTPGYAMEELKMLKEPIAMIAPDQDMRAFWDDYAERHGRTDLPDSHRVTVSYSDSSGNTYREESVIDLTAMEGATYVESKSIHDIGKTLDKMAKTLHDAPILSRTARAEVFAVTESREANDERRLRRDYERLLSAVRAAKASPRHDPQQIAAMEAKAARLEASHPLLKPVVAPPTSSVEDATAVVAGGAFDRLRGTMVQLLRTLLHRP